MMKNNKGILFAILTSLGMLYSTLNANEVSSSEALVKESQNPVANMYSVPLEFWHHDGAGPEGKGRANMAILRPTIPVSIGKMNVINRFILPYMDVSAQDTGGFGEVVLTPPITEQSGLGNLQYQAILSPSAPSSVIYGLGAMVEFPTHSGALGSDNYSAGPVLLVVGMPGNWVFGTLAQNLWSIGGSSDPSQDVNMLIWQYFVNYNFSDGWYLTTTPIMTADWTAESGEQWTVPVGGGVGKLMKFESFPPLDFKLQAFSNVVKPTGGPDWQMMFSVKLILPKQLFTGGMPK